MLSIFEGPPFCLSKESGSRRVQSGEFCSHNSVETMQDAGAELYRCVVVIEMKAKVGDGWTSEDARSRGLGSREGALVWCRGWYDECSSHTFILISCV